MNKETKKTSIGGQAVLEGVMMRGKTAMATAVRDEDGIIRLETKKISSPAKNNKFLKLPVVRGCVSFFQSFVGGIKVLMRSAEVYGEGEPSKFEKWCAKKLKIDVMSVIIFFSLVFGLGLAVFLFMWLPQTLRGLIEGFIGGDFAFGIWAKNFIEGGFKLFIFIAYILFCSLIKDVRRTFMYHGAEHKTIACYENGYDLTVENAKKCSRIHDRCGTTFLVFVMLISILVFACFESLTGGAVNGLLRVLCKIALLPIVAGISYELLKGLAKTDNPVFLPLKLPGMALQKITTKEPSDEMIEVAITAFNKVMEMDENESIKEVSFPVPKKRSLVLKEVKEKLKAAGIEENAESEWIVSIALNIKRNELENDELVSIKLQDKINDIVKSRIEGRPLWYCIGNTNFYGYDINVDERVLIPRPETELLVENALKSIDNESVVLDLCTGSGAIAIAIKKESGAKVVAVDISKDALDLARSNAKMNDAEIEFIESDMFGNLNNEKFDVIVSNPPYIISDDLKFLQREVKDFEPKIALNGGKDGLDYYRVIAKDAKKHLNDRGVLIMECGINQAKLVAEMLEGFALVEIIKDYENIERIVRAVL